jgi:sensor histidine kinase regulating citrate/malate metabolism
MLTISPNAPIVARACVFVHNKLHDTHLRKRLAIVPLLLAICLYIGFFWWSARVREQHLVRQSAAAEVLAAFEAANKSVLVVSEAGRIEFASESAEKIFGKTGCSKDLDKVYPALASPVQTAIVAANKRPTKHSLVQFVMAAADSGDKVQVSITAARVLDKTTVIVTSVPLSELNAVFDTNSEQMRLGK